jgi:hypothetical protein
MMDAVTIRIGESDKDHAFTVIYSTNLRKKGLPEVLAVDVDPDAREECCEVLKYAATCMLNSGSPMPDLCRRFLKRRQGVASYVAFLQVKDPVQLKTLFEDIMAGGEDGGEESGTPSPSPSSDQDMVILVMPMVIRRAKEGMTWGQVPPAPENKTKLRNAVWTLLELQKKSTGFLRLGGGDDAVAAGKENSSPNVDTAGGNQRVGVEKALAHPEKILWDCEHWKPKHIRYLEQNAAHFSTLAIDQIEEAGVSDQYIEMVCENAKGSSILYHNGMPIGGR